MFPHRGRVLGGAYRYIWRLKATWGASNQGNALITHNNNHIVYAIWGDVRVSRLTLG